MGTRTQAVDRYHTSQGPSTERDGPAAKVKVNFKVSEKRNAGQPDMLSQALHKHPPDIMDTQKFLKRPVDVKGHQYQPKGDTLKGRSPISGTTATGMGKYTSRPGGNPLGRAMNRVGTNAIGKASNRTGQKSGYPAFRPRGGGGKP